ncbi:MAG: TPM domain-containing protein [Proteobacteria bacterium]|nr:TPM domain-containing protein [Pseudomonadota bacterium]
MRSSLLLIGLFVVGGGDFAAAADFPSLTGRVVDAAGILRTDTEAELNRQLEAHERATGQQIVVATVEDLGGQAAQEPRVRVLPVGIFWLIVLFIVLSGFGGGRRGRGGLARAIIWGSVLNGMSGGRGGRSGGGGFRGGGGSFGGGGASGSW